MFRLPTVLFIALATACSSPAPGPDAGGGGGGTAGSGGAAGSGGGTGGAGGGGGAATLVCVGTCNTLMLGGPVVEMEWVAANAPNLSGGTAVNGTYYMTSSLVYTGTGGDAGMSGQKAIETIAITGARLDWVVSSNLVDGGLSPVTDGGACFRFTASLSADGGNQVDLQFTCGASSLSVWEYEASQTGVKLKNTTSRGTGIRTYTKQ